MSKTLLYTLLSATVMAAVSCNSPKPSSNDGEAQESAEEMHSDDIVLTQQQVEAVGITFGKIEERNLHDVVRVNGTTALNPQDRAEVSPLVGGSLRSITVIEGSKVAKGQTVAWIENTEIVALQREYLQNRSVLSRASRELQRQRELRSNGAGVEKNLQQAESDYETAQAAVTGLECQLRQLGINEREVGRGNMVTRIPVKSPIGGFVDKIYKSTGSYANTEQPVLTIVDDSKMHIDINVYEQDMTGLAVGQQVDFILTNNPSVHLTGVIYEFASSFTDNTKSVLAHVRITDKGGATKLIPGMYVTGTVQKGNHAVPAVPQKAIANSEGKHYIFILERTETGNHGKTYHFRRAEVMTGAEELGFVQVKPLARIPDRATIVTSGAFYLSSVLGEAAEHVH